jgi:hypothetical protein
MAIWSKLKSKIQKRYIAFFTVVPMLLLLAIVQAPCPVCDGNGSIYNNRMGQVAIVKVDSSLKTVGTIEGCVNYIIYTYDVILTLQNNGQALDASGYIRLGLVDYSTSKLLSSQYTFVDVPASHQIQTLTTVQFMIGLDSPRTTEVTAEIALGDMNCQACDGRGSVPFNNVPLLTGMRESFDQVERFAIVPILPPQINEDLAHEQEASMYNTEQWILENPETDE